MVQIFLLLLLILPFAEVYVLMLVADAIGGWNTFLCLIATSFIGGLIARSQGLVVYRRMQEMMSRGQLPAGELLQGLFVFFGGILLVLPGFITDALGLLIILPGSRHLLAWLARLYFQRQIARGKVGVFTSARGQHWSSEREVNPYLGRDSQDVIDVSPLAPAPPNPTKPD